MHTIIESSLLFTLSIITLPIINFIKKKSITIVELWIYPIKGCKGFKVNSSRITKRGLKHDRIYMVVDSTLDNKFISQRNNPKMALINTNIISDNELIINSVNHTKELRISLSNNNNNINDTKIIVTVWGIECEAYHVSDEASNWFCECLLKKGLKLVKLADDFKRIGEQFDSEVSFADQYPILLASNESLNNINSKLENKVQMENFRPNIVIKDVNEPFAEDKWKCIDVKSNNNTTTTNANITMHVPFPPCARCKGIAFITIIF
jgi:uncharacterized protein YcbX